MKPWRYSVRAALVDPADRILLVQFHSRVWGTPGGGADPGETAEQTLRRELAEEVGLTRFELGPCIWLREHAFELPGHCGQRDRIHVVRCPAFDPQPLADPAIEGITEVRWWTRDELDASTAIFAPGRLAAVFGDLLDDGPPAEPIDVGV